MAEPWKVSEVSGSAYAAPGRLNVYRDAQHQFTAAESAKTRTWEPGKQMGPDDWTTGGWVGGNADPNAVDAAFQATLTPGQRAEMAQLRESSYNKGTSTNRGGAAIAMAAMGGLGALAAEGAAGAGAGAGFGAGDAGAGMGWMGGAELGTEAAAYGGLGSGLLPAGEFMGAGAGGTWAGTEAGGSWLSNLMSSLGGSGGSFLPSSLKDFASIGSGLYGMYKANQQSKLAQQAIGGSSPWTASGGAANAGSALTNVINGNFEQDPGYKQAMLAAARASSQQPGGFAGMSAANAALKYQNDRIAALSGPAGVGFNPAAGYQTALGGQQMANQLASQSLGSIGYGMGGGGMPPWLQAYLVKNGMGG